MRRRWLLILGGALVVGVSAVFALALLASSAPFRFLDGHEPNKDLSVFSGPRQLLVYNFQADSRTFIAAARKELAARGFAFRMPVQSDWLGAELGSCFVHVDADMRAEVVEWDSVVSERWVGWVCVRIQGPLPSPNLLARLKAVFGL